MTKDGLAVAPQGITSAPTMYREEEQDETVARGCVRVTEVIAYDFVRMEKVLDELTGEPTDKERKIEKSRGPYFYQDPEAFLIFKENNPKARLETFGIQMLKSIAIKRIDKPENIKQFTRPEPAEVPIPPVIASVVSEQEPEPTWRQQAKAFGIPLNKETGGSRKKEDVLIDIVARLTQTTVSTS